MLFVPRLLNQVLPALSSDVEQVRKAGSRVNASLVEYIMSVTDDEEKSDVSGAEDGPSGANKRDGKDAATISKGQRLEAPESHEPESRSSMSGDELDDSKRSLSLDYEASITALTTQFLNENEATRAASLSWLIMLQRKAPKKVLAAHDGTFPALLRTLADTSDTVVTRDLQLLCQISRNSDDTYFSFFMVNLLRLFSDDRRLLETRGNLIIRQLCLNLSPEKIYRTMSDCLEKEDDTEFASIMVQNLNNNLITAPELGELRKKLRTWDQRVRLQCLAHRCKLPLITNRTAKHSSWSFSGRGATTQWLRYRCVCWLKRTSKHTICFKSCKYIWGLDYTHPTDFMQC